MSAMVCYGLIRNTTVKYRNGIRRDTSYGVCTTDEEQFATVQVRASTDKKCLKRIDTNRHRATQTYHYNQFVHTKTASGFRIQGSDPGQRDLLF